MLRWTLLVALILAFASCDHSESELPEEEPEPEKQLVDFSASTQQRMEAYLDSLFREKRFNGVALAYSADSLFTTTRGFRSLRNRDSLQVNDAFQLASVSKPLTAYAILKLADQGKIHLDHLVSEYLEGFPYADVTVRMLLNHTSGLGNYTYVTDSLWGMPDSVMINDDLLREFLQGHVPIYYEPGVTFDYCNSNYALLASIIDCNTGMDFSSFMKQEVFEPLGMDSSELLNPAQKTCLDYTVQGHYPNGKHKLPFYLNGITGDKGVYSTVYDLFRFYQEWKAPKEVSSLTISKSFEHPEPSKPGQFYALGWRMKTDVEGDTLIFHNGWWRGFRTYFWWSKKEDKCFIALTNTVRGGYLKAEEILSLY